VVRSLRVARTIADLRGDPRVDSDDVAEAIMDRAYEVNRAAQG
jgi:predicted ATPase with chaperone activity